jgi:hypothetical protein
MIRKQNIQILTEAVLYRLYQYGVEKGGYIEDEEFLKFSNLGVTSTFLKASIDQLNERDQISRSPFGLDNSEINGKGIKYVQV